MGRVTPYDFYELIGKKFNRMTILSQGETRVYANGNRCKTALCKCDCGKIKSAEIRFLINGAVKSCGCYSLELSAKNGRDSATHGMAATSEYHIWSSMKSRCLHKSRGDYSRYGGRGIAVCDRWLASFENFFEDMGLKPGDGYSIERVDNDGNYEPKNCRWATATEQANNRCTNRKIAYKGESKTIAEVCEITGLKWTTLYNRIFTFRWDMEKAINKPVPKARI